MKLDTSLLPILNVDLRFTKPPLTGALIKSTAAAVRDVAEQMRASPAEGRSLTAANFVVYGSTDANAAEHPLLHFTLRGDAMLAAAAQRKPAGFYLTLTQEAGANDSAAEAAVRDYCQATQIAFCAQALDR